MNKGVFVGLLIFIISVLASIILWIIGIPIFFAFLFLPIVGFPIFKKTDIQFEETGYEKPKFCPNCGYPLEGWENYCPRCGYKLK